MFFASSAESLFPLYAQVQVGWHVGQTMTVSLRSTRAASCCSWLFLGLHSLQRLPLCACFMFKTSVPFCAVLWHCCCAPWSPTALGGERVPDCRGLCHWGAGGAKQLLLHGLVSVSCFGTRSLFGGFDRVRKRWGMSGEKRKL